jgi:hypothetical protein
MLIRILAALSWISFFATWTVIICTAALKGLVKEYSSWVIAGCVVVRITTGSSQLWG